MVQEGFDRVPTLRTSTASFLSQNRSRTFPVPILSRAVQSSPSLWPSVSPDGCSVTPDSDESVNPFCVLETPPIPNLILFILFRRGPQVYSTGSLMSRRSAAGYGTYSQFRGSLSQPPGRCPRRRTGDQPAVAPQRKIHPLLRLGRRGLGGRRRHAHAAPTGASGVR